MKFIVVNNKTLTIFEEDQLDGCEEELETLSQLGALIFFTDIGITVNDNVGCWNGAQISLSQSHTCTSLAGGRGGVSRVSWLQVSAATRELYEPFASVKQTEAALQGWVNILQ